MEIVAKTGYRSGMNDMHDVPKPPICVLVRPQMGENIGAVARAMMNFGWQELRIVAPRDGWPSLKAREMAARAAPLIEQARIYEDIPAALADCQLVYASSARPREMVIPVETPAQAAGQLTFPAVTGRAAILFGPENNGLSNDDLAWAQRLIMIPAHPENTSLNLAQSAVVIACEWWQQARHSVMLGEEAASIPETADEAASHGERSALYQALDQALGRTDFYRPAEKKPLMQRKLRRILMRTPLHEADIRLLHGVLRALQRR